MLRLLAVAAATALATIPARAAAPGPALDYALPADIDTLDPHWAYDALSLFAVEQVYETLISFAGSSLDVFEPRAASVVPTAENGFLSRDGLSYAFPLRRGMRFHDGAPVTAEDVKYSLLRFLLLDRQGGPSSLLLQPLIGARSTDELPGDEAFDRANKAISVEGEALVIRLRKPFAPLMGILAGFGHIVPRAYVAANGGWDGRRENWRRHRNPPKAKSALHARANGSGPFRLASWEKSALVLERFEGYWRQPASLGRATLRTVPDARERRRELETGETDVAWLDRRALDRFEPGPEIAVNDDLPALETQNAILFNLKTDAADNPWLATGKLGAGVPPDFFADLELRKAFAQSFDYESFLRAAYHGKAVQARGPIPAVLFGYNPRQQPWSYAPAQAEAGFRKARKGEVWERGFTLLVAVPEGANERAAACRLLKEGVEKINPRFHVECRSIAQSRLLDEFRSRRLPCFIYRWVLDYPDPHNAIEPFLYSRGYFASQLGYGNPRADVLIDQAAGEIDPARRKALYFELQAMAIYDAPAIFTADSYNLIARRSNIQGWVYHPIQPYGRLHGVSKLRR